MVLLEIGHPLLVDHFLATFRPLDPPRLGEAADGNRALAAAHVGLSPSTFRDKLRKFDLQ